MKKPARAKAPQIPLAANVRFDVSFSGNEPNKLFRQRADGGFDDVSFSEGFASRADSRSLAAVDLDGDGRLDLVITNRNAPRVQLYRNESKAGNALQLRLEAREGVREAAGATVRVRGEGESGPGRVFPVVLARGYATAVEPVVHVGLGDAASARVEVRWPNGETQDLGSLKAGQRYRAVQAGEVTGTPFRTPSVAKAPEPVRRAEDVGLAEVTGVKVVPVVSSFCAQCRKHAPALNALAKKRPEHFAHGLALHGEDPEKTTASLKLALPVPLRDMSEALTERLEHWGNLATPMYLVFDAKGDLARVVRTPEVLEAVLEELTRPAATAGPTPP